MEYDRITLGRLAKKQGFVRDTLEKVCRLTDILFFMQQDGLLSGRLALKGGTAINLTVFDLPRLSVDIDLDYVGGIGREQMVSETLKLFDMCKPEGQNSKRGLTLDFGILSAEFSKPNWGNEDDYWPTQYLCEYIKHLGFDGIRFCSSINPESKNIVLFDTNENPVTKQKRYRIIGSQVFIVSSLNLETQQIAPFKEKS